MSDIAEVSAVLFRERTTEPDYLVIRDSTGNNSYVGRIGGPQVVNIFNWNYQFIVAHELLHALGFWHEHQRVDRDTYIQINWTNIEPGRAHNFEVRTDATPLGEYDFQSVMHYGQCAFSVCGNCSLQPAACRTITALPPFTDFQWVIGQRFHLSAGDIQGIQHLYGRGCVGSNREDYWSCARGLIILNHSVLHPAGYDIRDVFDGEFSPYTPERGGVVFSDAAPQTTTDWIEWETTEPVWIGRCEVWHSSDYPTTARGIGAIRMFAWSIATGDWVPFAHSNSPDLIGAPTVLEANGVIAQRFRIEFDRHPSSPEAVDGPRVAEINAFPHCRADWNQDLELGVPDIFAYLSVWFGGDLDADLDDGGTLQVADIFQFLTLWFAGC